MTKNTEICDNSKNQSIYDSMKGLTYSGVVTYALGRAFWGDIKETAKAHTPQGMQDAWKAQSSNVGTFLRQKAEKHLHTRLFALHTAYRNCPKSVKTFATLALVGISVYEHGKHLEHQLHDTKGHAKYLGYKIKENSPVIEEKSADVVAKMM